MVFLAEQRVGAISSGQPESRCRPGGPIRLLGAVNRLAMLWRSVHEQGGRPPMQRRGNQTPGCAKASPSRSYATRTEKDLAGQGPAPGATRSRPGPAGWPTVEMGSLLDNDSQPVKHRGSP
jgi:hypothetical protein